MFETITAHLADDIRSIEQSAKSTAEAVKTAWEHSMLHSILLNICSLTQDPKKRLEAAFIAGYQHGLADSKNQPPEAQPEQPQPKQEDAEQA